MNTGILAKMKIITDSSGKKKFMINFAWKDFTYHLRKYVHDYLVIKCMRLIIRSEEFVH